MVGNQPEWLDNVRRQALLAFVQANPGACLSDAARGTGIPKSSMMHHMKLLKREGLLRELRQGRYSRLLLDAQGAVNVRCLVAQRDARLNELLAWLRSNPNPAQKDALEAMETAGWSRSTTQHRLRRLVDAGLVCPSLKGRSKTYRAIGDVVQLNPPAWQDLQVEAGFEQAPTLSTEGLVKT